MVFIPLDVFLLAKTEPKPRINSEAETPAKAAQGTQKAEKLLVESK